LGRVGVGVFPRWKIRSLFFWALHQIVLRRTERGLWKVGGGPGRKSRAKNFFLWGKIGNPAGEKSLTYVRKEKMEKGFGEKLRRPRAPRAFVLLGGILLPGRALLLLRVSIHQHMFPRGPSRLPPPADVGPPPSFSVISVTLGQGVTPRDFRAWCAQWAFCFPDNFFFVGPSHAPKALIQGAAQPQKTGIPEINIYKLKTLRN